MNIEEAKSHLKTALIQVLPSDDKIIVDHMMQAYLALGGSLDDFLAERPFAEAGALLHKPNDPLPKGCYCKPGQCMAPVIMGRQMSCRDPEKAQGKQRCCDNGYFGEAHDCQKSNPEQLTKC